MIECYFGIASYKRADNQRTLDYLRRLGVEKERIIVSVQTDEDMESYIKAGVKAKTGRLIFRPGKNVSDNRNNILDSIPTGARIVLLDDDINSIGKLRKGKIQPIETMDEFDALLRHGFGLAAKHRTAGFGLYPCNNAFFMSNSYDERSIVIGTMFAIRNTELRFNPETATKEDYEYCCKAIRKYGAFIRLNNYACNAQHHTKGGCAEFWSDSATTQRTAKRLVGQYPDILALNPKRPGEVKMVRTRGRKK